MKKILLLAAACLAFLACDTEKGGDKTASEFSYRAPILGWGNTIAQIKTSHTFSEFMGETPNTETQMIVAFKGLGSVTDYMYVFAYQSPTSQQLTAVLVTVSGEHYDALKAWMDEHYLFQQQDETTGNLYYLDGESAIQVARDATEVSITYIKDKSSK